MSLNTGRSIGITGGIMGVVMCLLLGVLSATEAVAQSSARPFWTEQAMFRYGDELYFVGVASCATSPEVGRQQAFLAGMKELNGYAQERDTSRLFVHTAMIYEEANAANCARGTTSVWRLLRVSQPQLLALPRREVRPERPEGETAATSASPSPQDTPALTPPPSVRDLTPQAGMSREKIAERFGKPKTIRKEGSDEVWEYGDTGLTITFSANETLVNWALTGTPSRPQPEPSAPPSDPTRPAITAKPSPEAAPSDPVKAMVVPPPIPQSRDPVEEGRKLFNGKGACNTCHGRDADMYTDVTRDALFGVTPGYLPPIIGPFYGPSPRRVAPNLRDWSSLRIRTDLDLYRAIKDGIGGSLMTGTRHLSDREISDLVAYLNSLR